VLAGRANGAVDPRHYLEIRFEDLIADPRNTLQTVGQFIDHDLECQRIQRNPVLAMVAPNTSFGDVSGDFNPVGRWHQQLTNETVRLCETLIGRTLDELGYPRAFPMESGRPAGRLRMMRSLYRRHFSTKHWLKTRTPLARILTRTDVWTQQHAHEAVTA
jgi:hypothetical protein